MSTLKVRSYSPSTLPDVILNAFDPPQTSTAVLMSKGHLGYFRTYFGETNAQTIVIEDSYTDRDFLEDYAAYYVRCLDKYESRCCRLHFFSVAFDQTDFDALVKGQPARLTERVLTNPDNYLGFVVVRPLPQTFVGRTCLKVYPSDNYRRNYPVTRDYEVHLAGFTLVVRSLAFQEQDRATSACATSALWSAFQGTGVLFHHSILSPVEITRRATRCLPIGRCFPNNGLTLYQMASAISEIGLEPETLFVSKNKILAGLCYAYLRAGIPPLLIASLHDATDPGKVKPYDDSEPDVTHAVAVTGFSLGLAAPSPEPKSDTLFTHTRIDKLYLHDDQIGPFARAALAGPLSGIDAAGNPVPVSAMSLETSWRTKQGGQVRFAPEMVIIPLYHKIRISYLTVLAHVRQQDMATYEPIRAADPSAITERLEWDVYLTTGHALKASLRKANLDPDYRYALIQEQYPRFVWRATGLCGGAPLVDLLYDATDVETGDFFLGPIFHDTKLQAIIAPATIP